MSDKDLQARLAALERENAALRRVNAKLMRERISGSSAAGAETTVSRGQPGARPAAATPRAGLARARLGLRRVLLRLLR